MGSTQPKPLGFFSSGAWQCAGYVMLAVGLRETPALQSALFTLPAAPNGLLPLVRDMTSKGCLLP